MIRGFVAGVIWGGVVAAFGLTVASQVALPPGAVAGLPQADAPLPANDSTAPELPAPAPPAMAAPEPSLPDVVVREVTVPEASTAAPDTPVPAAPESETATLAAPEAAATPETAPATDAATPAPLADATPDPAAPVDDLPPPPGSEFARPLPEVDPTLPAAETAVPSETTPAVAAADPAQPPAPDTSSAARPDPAPQSPVAPAAPDAVTEPATLPAPEAGAIAAAEPAAPAAPAPEPAPEGAELPPPPPLTPEEQALLLPEPAVNPATPTPGFPDPVDGVTTGRLPSIGDTPAAAATPDPLLVDDDSLPPLQRYARAFENPAAKPLFALLLIDTGGPEVDRTALAALPFPVSFVIDPLAPDAATAAAIYRAAGQEVVMLGTGIPEGANAADLEVTFQTHATALPEAVAVIDLETGGFQGDRGLSAEVATIVKAQGRGLLTYERGLNAADQVARRDGLPTATIFRRLDGENESSPAIRRYLDRAAFKAAQEGRVAVIGTTRTETVAALLEWSVEGRASSVALAPATAVLAVQ